MATPSKSLTSSVIVAAALGIKPDGVKAKKEGLCAHCAAPIKIGELSIAFSVGPAFMDDHYLAAKGSDMTCGHCVVLMNKDVLSKHSHGIFTQDGVLPFRKWFDVDYGIRNPPSIPFVMLYATANNQHMAWRAPVNYSRDLFRVRVGLRDLGINRAKLISAFDTGRRMGRQIGKELTATSKSFESPFRALSSDLKNEGVDCGAMYWDVDAKCSAQDIAQMQNLSLGELWGMAFLKSPGLNHAELGKTADCKHTAAHKLELAKAI